MKIHWKFTVAIIAVIGGASILFWGANHHSLTRRHIVFADANQILSALVYVAQAKGFFDQEGLSVESLPFNSGKKALASVIEGKADMAAAADTPIAISLAAGHQIAVFASIETTDKDVVIVTRSESKIRKPQDLAGKRVGTVPGTGGDYFLHLFLIDSGLLNAGITLTPVTVDQAPTALASGSIDALATWTTMRLDVEKMNSSLVSLSAPGLYTEAWALAVRPDFAAAHSDTLQRMLRALLAAERFAVTNREQAIKIVTDHIGMTTQEVDGVWDNFDFTVRLDQALVVNLESQVSYFTKGTPDRQIPDILGAIHAKDLAAVDPSRVTAIH